MPGQKGNKNALGNNGGRPELFKTPIDLQKKIDFYFRLKKEKKTICGLAYFLGFESRQSLYDYEQKIEFSYIIKRARLRIEMIYEQNLQSNISTGSIFALKNMKWHDKIETELSGIPPVVNINVTSKESADRLKDFLNGKSE